MALNRLGTLCSHVALFVLAVTLALPPDLYSQVAPHREIVPVDASGLPQWKSYWDLGREYARQGDYKVAAEHYEQLLRWKPQIEEAKWEYCKILVKLQRFAEASMLLESLIEDNPYRLDYLALAGNAALETGEYGRAVRYLGQVYDLQPAGEEGIQALRGLIRGLQGLGRDKYAFVLMEQLRQRSPDDLALLHDLARKATELGYVDKAADYYSALLNQGKGGKEALREAAQMFAASGREERAASLWRKLLQGDPQNQAYHKHLLDYYRKTGASDAELPHLLSLLDVQGSTDPQLLLETARIYSHDQGRADKALKYYERYLQARPDDLNVAGELELMRRRVADTLLATVENDGAASLWSYLGTVTDNRLIICRFMAEKLEKSGKTSQLIQVLELLYQHAEGDPEQLAQKLATLYGSAGRPEESYSYLTKIHSSRNLSYSYYRQRAKLELQLGYDVAALASLMQALAKSPESDELRGQCIRLAGQLGFVEKMHYLGQPLLFSPLSAGSYDLYSAYLEGLRLNGLYTAALSFSSRILDTDWGREHYHGKLLLEQADILTLMGQPYESQRILRTLLVAEEQTPQEVIAQLMEHALASGSVKDGWALLRYYAGQPGNTNWKTRYDEEDQQLFLAYVHLLVEEGNYASAKTELASYIAGSRTKQRGDTEAGAGNLALELELCRLYLLTGEKDRCRQFITDYNRQGKLPSELRLVQNLTAPEDSVAPKILSGRLPGVRDGKGGVEALFAYTRGAVALGHSDSALDFITEILRRYPDSLRARVEKAALLKRQGKLAEASEIYQDLWRENNEETSFYTEYLTLEFKLGHYDVLTAQLGARKHVELPIELKLMQARTLWAKDQHSQAFALYHEMLTPPVSTQFRKRLAEEKLQFKWQERAKQTFWDMFRYEEPDQLDKLNGVQGEEGFLSMLKTPVGRIAAELYDSYRWEKLIGDEYKVRKAVEEHEYIVAEKQYRKNLEKAKSTEGLKDLARIYKRLGDYGKEAEVYSYLEQRGEKTPELQESMERNRLARAPTLGVNYSYLEKEGRDGQINLEKNSVGTSFQYMPGLNSSLQMDYSELFYESATGDDDGVDGRLFSAAGMYKFNEKTSVDLGAGLHILDSGGDSTPLFDVRLNRRLDELLSGYVQYKQELIDDTVEALNQSLSTNSIVGGLVLEGTTGVTIGGEFERLWYDDDNSQNRIFLWSSYAIFHQLTTYELKYSYEMLNTKDDDTAVSDATSAPGSGGAAEERVALPYWSPSEYWQHLFSLRIHHLLKDPAEEKMPPSSYSFNISAGYESNENIMYSAGFDIFLEISGNFLLKGELLYADSSDYDEQRAAISVMYRW